MSIAADIIVRKDGKKFDEYLSRAEKFGFSGTVLVAKEGQVVLQKSYGFADYQQKRRLTVTDLLSIGSISKQFTAAAILKLVDKKMLTLETTLDEVFKDSHEGLFFELEINKSSKSTDGNIPGDKEGITIHHLLTHSSGLGAFHGGDLEPISKREFVNRVLKSPLEFRPGAKYLYSNSGYSILGIIIEELTQTTYTDFMINELFKPVGMDRTGWFQDPRWEEENAVHYYVNGKDTGTPMTWRGLCWPLLGNGGVCTTVQELYLWLEAIKQNTLLSKEITDKMFTVHIEDYGYGWQVERDENTFVVQHNGGSRLGVNAQLKWDIGNGITQILLSNVILGGEGVVFDIEEPFDKLVYGNKVSYPPKVTGEQVALSEFARFLGNYGHNNRLLVTLEKNDNDQFLLKPRVMEGTQFLMAGLVDKRTQEKHLQLTEKLIDAIKSWDTKKLATLLLNNDRADYLMKVLQEWVADFQSRYGISVVFRIMGSMPHSGILATHIKLLGKSGSSGFKVLWQDDKIYGFIPSFSAVPFKLMLVPTTKKPIAYDLQNKLTISLKFEETSDGIILRIDSENKEKMLKKS